MPLAASAETLANFDFAGGSTASTDSSALSIVSAYDARSVAVGGDDSDVSSGTGTAYMRAENTPNSSDPATNTFYHTFNVTVAGLGVGETLDLTSLSFDYTATQISGTFIVGTYSDAVGYTDTSDKLATTDITTNAGDSFVIDLTDSNTVAGTAFTGLTNGQIIEFRFVFGDNSVSNSRIHRLDNITLEGQVDGSPPASNLIVNSDFEATPFDSDWNASGVISESGLNGSTTAARLSFDTTATLSQSFTAQPDFTFDTYVQVAGANTDPSFRILLDGTGGTAIEITGRTGNVIQLNHQGVFADVTRISDGANFPIAGNSPIRIRIIGYNFGTVAASYDLAWSEPGSTTLSHSATSLTSFSSQSAAQTGAGISAVRFDRANTAAHSYWVDDVSLVSGTTSAPTADYELIIPLPDKVVNISGIYPHLTLTNEESSEVGIGAVVPWADRLWAVTYTGHAPNGSTDKLYEITPGLDIITRAESIGGTPANRFIHDASQQLNIGPYFIDASRNVRVLPYTGANKAPGRPTGTAAHLTDPDNRLYIMTMENAVYDVNVHDLSFITRYPDIQGKGDRFLFGYHGKGLYSGQGQLVAANNGRPKLFSDPTGPAGVLATWDGTTVADNGGSYFVTNDANDDSYNGTVLEESKTPVAAQPDYIAGWTQHYKIQHCEVTGPGGIHGPIDAANDPIWTTGFDDKSVVLRTMEDGATWNTWRLPKGSYSHDGTHGWHTEWPRIRQLDPSDPTSPYLMHMHGLFYNFPKTFSSGNSANLDPICAYYKMPTDYCMFNDKLVMGKDDASFFENPLTLRTQSNLWFGEFEDLQDWGTPHGHGGLWKYEDVSANTLSEPFLVNGFSRITLHLKHTTGQSVDVEIQTSNGDNTWVTDRTVSVTANGYHSEILNDLSSQWVRLKPTSSATSLTAYFLLSNPFPHTTPASIDTDEFAALADIKDDKNYSDGLLRVMASANLEMEIATAAADGSGSTSNTGYHIIGGPMILNSENSAAAESDLRLDATTSKDFDSDAASVWFTNDISGQSIRLRLPRLDPAYDSEFPSGWARGIREIVTERSLFNCQGTFYEVPRTNSAGRYRMRPISTHGKRITDFTAWRGLLVLTGVLDDAPESDRLVRNAEGAALWLGEADDLWQMGEPRGYGGPWLDTAVTADTASDAYLMYGYDQKTLSLSHEHGSAVNITIEVDFLADYTWSTYQTFTVQPGETFVHTFPTGYHAHWVRVTSDTSTTASAQFNYGPVEQRDALLDWARDNDLATGSGRAHVGNTDTDGDSISDVAEFVFGTSPTAFSQLPFTLDATGIELMTRDLVPEDGIDLIYQLSNDLSQWTPRNDLLSPHTDQTGMANGFTRYNFSFLQEDPQEFVRIQFSW